MRVDAALPLLCFAAAALTTWLMVRRHVPIPLDRPDERALHRLAVPRGGGLGIWLGWVIAWPWLTIELAWLGPAVVLASISLLDDARSVSIRWRLLTHVSVSTAFVVLALPGQI